MSGLADVGQHQPGPQRGAVGRGGLDLVQPAGQRRLGGGAREELGLAGLGRVEPHHQRRAVHRRAQGVEELPVRRGAQAGVGAVVGAEPGDGPGVQVSPQHRAAAVVRGGDEDPRAVRGPGQFRGPVLQPGEQVQGFRGPAPRRGRLRPRPAAPLPRNRVQRHLDHRERAGLVVGLVPFPDGHDPLAVR